MSESDYAMRLRRFAQGLANQGFHCELSDATGERPYEVLLVALEDEGVEPGRWQLELSFIPGMEGQLEGLSLLQCFVGLPVELQEPAVAETQRVAVVLNRKLPLVGFGVLEEPRLACFRHTMLLPSERAPSTAMVVQATWLIGYLLKVFGPAVVAVASGRATLAEALVDHPFRTLFKEVQ